MWDFSYRRRPVSRNQRQAPIAPAPRNAHTFPCPDRLSGLRAPERCHHGHAHIRPADRRAHGRPLGRHECESCPMARVCHPACAEPAMAQGERGRRLLRRGEALFRAGDALQYLYQCARRLPEDPRHQSRRAGTDHRVSGLWRPARLDAIESGFHACDAIALEDSLLCALPYAQLVANCGLDPLAARQFHRLIAHDINHCQRLLLTLGRMSTDEAHRQLPGRDLRADGRAWLFRARVHPENDTRGHRQLPGHGDRDGELVFSRLQAASLLQVSKRHLKLPDIDALRRMSSG